MSLAFSVEGFLFYVHLHGNDNFKVNRTLFILGFGTTIVFLLAVESDRFASVEDPDLPIRGGGGHSFLGMVMYANEFKTKENQKLTEIKN